ncbi:sensor histidine kinase [Streptomyces bugieae]|uniref:histidine kinase n=1 Tax=Streptomyces bugieae TaxID=3098223 RepID=A0ABU7NK73_9ACTN|nr:sensor histidine kinase [Streptomyces sp. DSM 41528]
MKTGGWRGRRPQLGAPLRGLRALRRLPRTLGEDLCTTRGAPLPRLPGPSWLDWLPAFGTLWVLTAGFLAAFAVDSLHGWHGMDDGYALLFGGGEAVALVVAMVRPVPAWWAVTLVMVVVARASEANVDPDVVFPWTVEGIATQSGVLLLLAFRHRLRVAVEALVITLVAGVVCAGFVTRPHNFDVGRAVPVLITAVVVGAALRGRWVARAELAEQEVLTAEERARRTLLEERSRIARELHDVVAHHMSVISIQAQVAPHLVENPSDELRENLAGIRENAVEALAELRRVLGVLRSEEALAHGTRHAPQPTLDRLDELIGKVRDAGVEVTAESTGTPRPLAPGVELSAYRIVQEALSNAMRHAPGAAVRVTLGHHHEGLTLRITNSAPTGPVPRSPGSGHGLLGMRERTAMLGGELATGYAPDGGYEVTAYLPADAARPATTLPTLAPAPAKDTP